LRGGIERKVEALGLASRVIFAGSRGDVPRLMLGAMDVLCMPSLWEGVPVVLMEAQAAGLPCLCSEAITEEAIVVPGLISRVPLSAGAEAWGSVLVSTLQHRSVSREEALVAVANSPFNISNSVKELTSLYEDELARVGRA